MKQSERSRPQVKAKFPRIKRLLTLRKQVAKHPLN